MNETPGMNGFIQLIFLAAFLIIIILTIAGMWKTYQKAGKAGWECIVPIYNNMVLAEIVGKPMWWGLLAFIPYVGLIWAIWLLNLLSKSFGKDAGFTLGLIFLPFIFFPILGFGAAQYIGPGGNAHLQDEIDMIGKNPAE
jgi:hypothetical protein